MPQKHIWENEYRDPKLLQFSTKPQPDTLAFFRYIKKQCGQILERARVLDLGTGTGKNANYCASRGAIVDGMDISPTAIAIANEQARGTNPKPTYTVADIGSPLPYADESFDIILDVMTSNSLNERERSIYCKEVHRLLKPGGFLFLKTLAKEGDKNAKFLLKHQPGPEKDTYVMKELGLVEHVFSREDLSATYTPVVNILSLTKKFSYTKMNDRSYKRAFWLLYGQKI